MADEKTKSYVLRNTTMFIAGVEYHHGDEVELDAKHGDNLAEQGLVVAKADAGKVDKAAEQADTDDAKAQGEAVEAAEAIEESKVRSAHEARVAQAQPAQRPGRPSKNG